MKLKILFLALFVAGIAASIALAAPSGDGSTTAASTTGTATTSTGKHGDKDGEHGKKDKPANAEKCRNVELRGTLAAGTLTVAVDKSGGPGKALVGSSATLTVGGKVRVSARLCSAGTTATAQTLQLRELKVDKGGDGSTTATTTTTTTTP
jgi:hypothetical protein